MSEDTKLKELIINTLSPEQMPEVLSETEIYLVEDDAEYATVEELAEKQDVITDLDTIRDGASAGSTAVQPAQLDTKQDKLTAGDNITIENNVISAEVYEAYTKEESDNLLNNKVSKTGDTMSGTLTIANNGLSQSFVSKTLDFDQLANYTDTIHYSNVSDFMDNQNRIIARMFNFKDQYGTTGFGFQHFYNNGFVGDFALGRTADGKAWFNHPQIVQTYINGTSGYRVWSDGYCEQWGNVTTNGGNDNGKTITFAKTFLNTDYIVNWDFLGTANAGQQAGDWIGVAFTQSRAVGSMNISIGGYNYRGLIASARWIAKGYLRADQY